MIETDPDQLSEKRTIYQAGLGEIFWRNMVAGAGRAIGAIIFQAVFLFVVINMFNQYLMPAVQPLIDTLKTATTQLQNMQNSNSVEIERK